MLGMENIFKKSAFIEFMCPFSLPTTHEKVHDPCETEAASQGETIFMRRFLCRQAKLGAWN